MRGFMNSIVWSVSTLLAYYISILVFVFIVGLVMHTAKGSVNCRYETNVELLLPTWNIACHAGKWLNKPIER